MGVLIAVGDDAELRAVASAASIRASRRRRCRSRARGASRSTSSTRRSRGSAPRPTSRSRRTPCSSARARSCSSASTPFSVEGHMAFDALLRFSPFYLIVEISARRSLKAFGLGRVQHRPRVHARGADAVARARAAARSRLLFFEISAELRRHLGRVARHDPAADRGRCRCSRPSSTRGRTGARCRRRRRTCSCRCASSSCPATRWCCIRRARSRSARTPCRSA